MPVHIAGIPCAMDEIRLIAREENLAVIEDAAHAFPSRYHGRQVGSFPTNVRAAACFSFYATKTITTGEGGMITTDDESLATRARTMSLHGLSHEAWSRYSGGGWAYDIEAPGFKYNMTDIAAAIGLVQLGRAATMREKRAKIAEAYSRAFETLQELQCPKEPKGVISSWHLYPLRLKLKNIGIARNQFIEAMNALGVSTSVHFVPLHLHSYYADTYGFKPGDYPRAEEQASREISLPIYSAMTTDDVGRVIGAVKQVVMDARGT